MVRISVCTGILMQLWKVPKVLNFERLPKQTWFGIIPKYKYVYKQSSRDMSTSDYDRLSFKYYSFCLSTIYEFLLTFGFIMMSSQLFINYKLKSVSHLPWRMMTCQALNTSIADLSAFVIKMPAMYRIGCFRDDINSRTINGTDHQY